MTKPTLITKHYKGTPFLFRQDGYFNMTKAAQAFGKRLENFWRTDGVRMYCFELSQALGANDSDMSDLSYGLTEAKRGNNGGTWGHPKLAVFFARWLDVKFAVFCDMVIDDILAKKATLTVTKPQESAAMALPQTYLESLQELVKAVEERERLVKENTTLTQEKAVLQHKVDHVTIRQYERDLGIYMSPSQRQRLAKAAKDYCALNNLPIEKVLMKVEKRGMGRGEIIDTTANVYPRDALEWAADHLRLAA